MAEIREANDGDLDAVLHLAGLRRRRYAAYQPRVWRPARDADAVQRQLLARAMGDPEGILLVAMHGSQVAGFVLARLVQSPAVYDPGGGTCFIDDFAVTNEDLWSTVGVQLLRAAVVRAAARSAVQVFVVAAHLDAAKRWALREAGLAVALETWVATIGRPLEPGEGPPTV
jgi:hypothetical protein